MYVELRNSQFPIFKINQIHRLRQTGFLNVAQLVHHSVLFFPSNHFRRSATPMLYALPSLAAGSSLAYKALRICLSLVPMRMAASLTVTAIRSSNGDLEDTIHRPFRIERLPAIRFTSPVVPIGCVVLIAFLPVKVGMHPRTLDAFVLLGGFVRPRPIALGIPPQPGEGVRQSGRRLGRGERLAEFVQRHLGYRNLALLKHREVTAAILDY